jgi:hypothetical protein
LDSFWILDFGFWISALVLVAWNGIQDPKPVSIRDEIGKHDFAALFTRSEMRRS